MISVYFLPLPHLVQCFFSSARRMLLSFQPMGDMLEFCLEITKQEDCVFISVLGLKKPRLIPYSNKNSLFDILQNASFLHTSENSLTVLLSCVNSETPSEKQRYHFLFVTHHLCLFILQSLQDWDFSPLWVYTVSVIQWSSGTAQNL